MAYTTISNLFGSSPIRPLQSHMAAVQACVIELVPFLEATLEEDWDAARTQQKKISLLEKEADKQKKELRLHLPSSLFMPVSRRDILEVLTMQDKVANKAKDIAGLMMGRKMVIPEHLGQLSMDFLDRCIDASAQAQTAINELDELVETGFRGKEVDLVQAMIKELDSIESDTDKLQVKLRGEIFKLETNMPPIDVMFLYKIIEWIGGLADLAQRVGSRLELMLAR